MMNRELRKLIISEQRFNIVAHFAPQAEKERLLSKCSSLKSNFNDVETGL